MYLGTLCISLAVFGGGRRASRCTKIKKRGVGLHAVGLQRQEHHLRAAHWPAVRGCGRAVAVVAMAVQDMGTVC